MRSILIASVAAVTVTASAIADDRLGPDWMSKEQVTQRLQERGYTSITSIEADDGHWEGKGIKNGKTMEFHVDPRSGELTKEELDD